ncbi:hypothetical protein BH11PSE8_BH11PSE8_47070 [soil metagenome]
MQRARIFIVVATALWLTSPAAHALGFGRIVNQTQLGQPLNFAAMVRLTEQESLARECVSAEVYSGDNRLQSSQVRVTLEPGADANERSVRVTSNALIDEPVLTVNVTVGCTAKMSRRFVTFIDPPGMALAPSEPVTEALAPQRSDSQLAPVVAIVQAAAAAYAAQRSERSAQRPAAASNTPSYRTAPAVRTRLAAWPVPAAGTAVASAASKPKADERRKSKPPVVAIARAAAPKPSNSSGARLQLEAAPALAAHAASSPIAQAASSPIDVAALAAVASAASAASAAQARAAEQTALLNLERERIQRLEDGMTRLRTESQATRQSLTQLQSRLKDAETDRYSNPLVYALAGLSALLAALAAALWWRQSHAPTAAQWWAAPPLASDASAGQMSESVFGPASAPAPLGGATSGATGGATSSAMGGITAAAARAAEAPTSERMPLVDIVATSSTTTSSQPGLRSVEREPAHELSVEELMDLEQQAEFFIVLGQDEAAIDLLMSHVRSSGGNSPLPYLKLLEVYRRRGDTDAYQRIRERFNRRFSAYAPEWDADLQLGKALEDYPEILARLQGLWIMPTRVMTLIDASLFRRNASDDTFDLPAYRELLFLYSIARDLAEEDAGDVIVRSTGSGASGERAGGDVDLLLPLDDAPLTPGEVTARFEPQQLPDDEEAESTGAGVSRLLEDAGPAVEFEFDEALTDPVDLDVSMPEPKAVTAAQSAQPASNEIDFAIDSGFLNLDLPVKPSGTGHYR